MREIHAAGLSIDQSHAEEDERRRYGGKDQIFNTRLNTSVAVTQIGG
jgi:hypothetical protein